MAHRSKKKHLKHVHAHEPATPPAKSPIAKAEAAAAGIAKKAGKRRAPPDLESKRRPGLVRRLADKASETIADAAKLPGKLAAKPRRVIKRVKARVMRSRKTAARER
jgi:hypothetical protein